jgi:predicted kinase
MAVSLAYQSALDPPLLVVLGGAPGVGKSGIAEALSQELNAVYLRMDAIEGPIQASRRLRDSLGPVGYSIAYQLAILNLELGNRVVADCVNPVPTTRHAWASVAWGSDAHLVRIEITCSDADEHRRRVENRRAMAPGHGFPNWQDVMRRRVDPWPEAEISLDTSLLSVGQAVREILEHMKSSGATLLPQ